MNEFDEKLYSSLIQTIYSSPFEPDGWDNVLQELTRCLDSQWAQFHVSDFVSPGIPLSSLYPFEESALRDYVEHYVNIDPRASILTKRDNRPRNRREIITDSQFHESEIYNDFLSMYGAEQSLIVPIEGLTEGINFVAVMRGEKSGHYGDQEARILRPLISHIQQSILIQKRVIDSRTQSIASTTILNSLDIGVIFLSKDGRIIFLNDFARNVTEQKDSLLVSRLGYLKASREPENVRLKSAIDNAILANRRNLVSSNDALSISRNSGKPAYQALVAAVSIDYAHRITPEACAVVFVSDPSRAAGYPARFLQALYGLTPTEAKLAMAIAGGSTIEEYCAENCVSIHTARTQLKKALNKCDVRRQSDLVRKVLQVPASSFQLFE